MKVGPSLEDNLRRAAIMREEIGPARKLMMDANQCWDVGEAIRQMNALARFDPWWIEEPTSPDASGMPIAAHRTHRVANPARPARTGSSAILKADASASPGGSCRVARVNESGHPQHGRESGARLPARRGVGDPRAPCSTFRSSITSRTRPLEDGALKRDHPRATSSIPWDPERAIHGTHAARRQLRSSTIRSTSTVPRGGPGIGTLAARVGSAWRSAPAFPAPHQLHRPSPRNPPPIRSARSVSDSSTDTSQCVRPRRWAPRRGRRLDWWRTRIGSRRALLWTWPRWPCVRRKPFARVARSPRVGGPAIPGAQT